MSANYTLSHCISDLTTSEFRNGLYQDSTNRRYGRSNCAGTDRRQIVNFNAVVATPKFSNHVLDQVAPNWRLSPIFRWQSGPFLTITSGVDSALNGIGGQRANQIVADPKLSDPTLDQYFVANAFATPANGAFGNLGSNNIQGRSSFQFDAGLSREFRLNEQRRLEFRAEAYSILNHPFLGQPNVAISGTNFGKTTSTTGERIMQFALKYQF